MTSRQPTIRRDNRIAKIIAIVCGVTLPVAALACYGYWWWSGLPDRDIANPCTGESKERLSQVLGDVKLSPSSPYPGPSVLGRTCSIVVDFDNTVVKQGDIMTFRFDGRDQEEWAEGVVQDRCNDIATADHPLPSEGFALSGVDELCAATSRTDVGVDGSESEYDVQTKIAARKGADVITISYSEKPGDSAAVSAKAEKIAAIVVGALDDGDG